MGHLFTPVPVPLTNGKRWKPTSQEMIHSSYKGKLLETVFLRQTLTKMFVYFLFISFYLMFVFVLLKSYSIQVMNDLVPNVEQIRSRAQHMKTKIQPLVIDVEPTVSLCKDFYVVIDKNYYRFDNIRTAVDVCFKCVHALHAEYSPQSEAIWYFLQLALYDLHTQWDKTIPQVSKQLKCLSEK